ncbi:MAG: cysteine-rich CWC family protein [Bacteroidota bacterium]
MLKHEEKNCPRCKRSFECKVGCVTNCQCSQVTLNDVERKYLNEIFQDCLCASCMLAMRSAYHAMEIEKVKRLLLRHEK